MIVVVIVVAILTPFSVMLTWNQHQFYLCSNIFFKSNVLRFFPKNNDCYYGNNRVLSTCNFGALHKRITQSIFYLSLVIWWLDYLHPDLTFHDRDCSVNRVFLFCKV